jgi:hypothetical protein
MDAGFCALVPAGETAGATVWAKEEGTAAAANAGNKRKFRCLCMPNSLSWFAYPPVPLAARYYALHQFLVIRKEARWPAGEERST